MRAIISEKHCMWNNFLGILIVFWYKAKIGKCFNALLFSDEYFD